MDFFGSIWKSVLGSLKCLALIKLLFFLVESTCMLMWSRMKPWFNAQVHGRDLWLNVTNVIFISRLLFPLVFIQMISFNEHLGESFYKHKGMCK